MTLQATLTPPASFRRKLVPLALSAALATMAASHAHAQADTATPPVPKPASEPASSASTGPGEAQAAGRQQLDTVIVSATRRREPAREVPIVVNTLSVPQLERSGAASLIDFIGGLPGVDVKNEGGPGRGQVSIRGVTTGDQSIATVGVYVDDVAFGSNSAFVNGASSALDMSLLDLNHIELLRGPQGTLYGAGAMGGLLKYVTNEPDTAEFSGKATLSLRNSQHGGLSHTESAIVNVPLKENVAGLRVAAFHDHEVGFVDATGLAAGRGVNGGNTNGVRASVLLEPTSRFKIRLTATAQDLKRGGLNYVNYDIATGRPIDGELTRPLATREPYDVRIRLGSADLEYDLGWARFNSITSVQRMDSRTGQDVTSVFGPGIGEAIGAPVDIVGLNNTLGLRKTTQEFRLTSTRGTVEWLAGLYYDKERGKFDQLLWARAAADGSVIPVTTTGQPTTYQEIAAYGDVTFNPAPGWSLTAGARVARNKQDYEGLVNDVSGSRDHSKDSTTTYLATVRYALTKVSNVYFRAASGYRPGGPNPPAIDAEGQVVPGAPPTFKPDSLWSYELGYKADLLDKTLSIEAALYDIRWNDLQQQLAIGATTVITNAGKASVKGAELSARWQATPAWSLDTSFAFVDGKLTEDAPALGPSGSRLPNTARFSGTLGASHRFDLASHPAYAGANLRYVGKRNAGYDSAASSTPNFVMPSYTMVDLQAGMEFGAFELGLFVRNVANQRAILGANTHLVPFGFPLGVNLAQPRTIGATLSAKF